ncbi:interleukin-6 receptor subunit beta-like [Pholidichthys leucotaenia]
MYTISVLFVLAVISTKCKGQYDPCHVFPKNQYILVGKGTKVICSCMKGSKIYWTVNAEHVDEKLSERVNATHAILSLNDVIKPLTVECHNEVTHQVVGGTTIRTYTKPINISCILYHEDQGGAVRIPELLTCSWEHHIDTSLKVNYTVQCASSSAPDSSKKKRCSSQKKTCTFKNILTSIGISDDITVAVTATTAFWEVVSDPYEVHLYHIFKTIRPELKVTARPDELFAQWRRTEDNHIERCEVKYRMISSAKEEPTKWSFNYSQYTTKHTIEKVKSCINYTVSVRCALERAPWSEWSHERTILTKLSNHQAVKLWRKLSDLGKKGVRNVHVMWTGIPSTCEGTFNYTIKQIPIQNHKTEINDHSCGNTTCDITMDADVYRLNLTVFHNETPLVEESVYVPAAGENFTEVTDIQTSSRKGTLLVSWKPPTRPVDGYMIDWTHVGNQYFWKRSEDTNATLFNLQDKTPYNITVTPLFDGKTGHGVQALLVCSALGDPGDVIVSVEPADKTAVVTYSVKSQDPCRGVVNNYTIFYGKQKGPVHNVTVDGQTKGVTLKDLKPDTEYHVNVTAMALTGNSTSKEMLFTTKKMDPSLIITLGVCGCIFILLVLTLGLCCTVQWKKFKDKPVPNPGLSSVALWSSQNHQKGKGPFQQFLTPSESFCDRVHTEDTQTASTSSLATDCFAPEQTEENTDMAICPSPDTQYEQSVKSPCSPGESTAFLPSESSPYRSQSSVENPNKQCKRVPVKLQERTPLKTVYVTLDMFKEDQSR